MHKIERCMLIEVKRLELKQKARQKAQEKALGVTEGLYWGYIGIMGLGFKV